MIFLFLVKGCSLTSILDRLHDSGRVDHILDVVKYISNSDVELLERNRDGREQ